MSERGNPGKPGGRATGQAGGPGGAGGAGGEGEPVGEGGPGGPGGGGAEGDSKTTGLRARLMNPRLTVVDVLCVLGSVAAILLLLGVRL